jgi:hypothetical protein
VPDVPSWSPPAKPYVEEAMSADAVVVEERGRWIVYLDVVLESGAVRRRVGDHHDERRARQAASIIERNARRCIPRLVTRDPSEFTPPHRIDHRPVAGYEIDDHGTDGSATDGPATDRGDT